MAAVRAGHFFMCEKEEKYNAPAALAVDKTEEYA